MKVAFLGCGKMGQAILAGMLSAELLQPEEITVILPENSETKKALQEKFAVNFSVATGKIDADYLLIAIKPQQCDQALHNLNIPAGCCVISIVAGKSTKYFSKVFPNVPVIRTMPNINALVQNSATVGFANHFANEKQLHDCHEMFETIGSFDIVEDENDIDLITALAGSGPAYYFNIVEIFAEIATDMGLKKELANKLIANTFIGSAKSMLATKLPACELKKQVTSKGGTTEAALQVLNKDNKLRSLLSEAVLAAQKRAAELGGDK